MSQETGELVYRAAWTQLQEIGDDIMEFKMSLTERKAGCTIRVARLRLYTYVFAFILVQIPCWTACLG